MVSRARRTLAPSGLGHASQHELFKAKQSWRGQGLVPARLGWWRCACRPLCRRVRCVTTCVPTCAFPSRSEEGDGSALERPRWATGGLVDGIRAVSPGGGKDHLGQGGVRLGRSPRHIGSDAASDGRVECIDTDRHIGGVRVAAEGTEGRSTARQFTRQSTRDASWRNLPFGCTSKQRRGGVPHPSHALRQIGLSRRGCFGRRTRCCWWCSSVLRTTGVRPPPWCGWCANDGSASTRRPCRS